MLTAQRARQLLCVFWFAYFFCRSPSLDCKLKMKSGSCTWFPAVLSGVSKWSQILCQIIANIYVQTQSSAISEQVVIRILSQCVLLFSQCTKDTTKCAPSLQSPTVKSYSSKNTVKFMLPTNIHFFSLLLKLTYLHSWWMTNQITNQLQEIHRCILLHLLSSLVCLLVCPSKSPHVEKPWEGKKISYFDKNHKYHLFLPAKERITKAT